MFFIYVLYEVDFGNDLYIFLSFLFCVYVFLSLGQGIFLYLCVLFCKCGFMFLGYGVGGFLILFFFVYFLFVFKCINYLCVCCLYNKGGVSFFFIVRNLGLCFIFRVILMGEQLLLIFQQKYQGMGFGIQRILSGYCYIGRFSTFEINSFLNLRVFEVVGINIGFFQF